MLVQFLEEERQMPPCRRRYFLASLGAGSLFAASGFPLLSTATGMVLREEFEIGCCRDVRVRMRDGVHLATDVYFPKKDGERIPSRLPAVLLRTPYDKSAKFHLPSVEFFARHGYLSVVQDCRGRFKSEGGFFLYHEATDGCDTVEWIAEHDWCDGNVGMQGFSSPAWSQIAAASQVPKGLKTIVPHAGTTNAFRDNLRRGGTIHLGMLRWLLMLAETSPKAKANPDAAAKLKQTPETLGKFLEMAYEVPWERGATALAAFPEYEQAALDLFFNKDIDAEFWRQPSLSPDAHFEGFPDIPALWITGWWDRNLGTMTRGFERLSQLNRKQQYLIIGPWMHSDGFAAAAGDFQFSSEGAPFQNTNAFLQLQLTWFDRWLRGEQSFENRPKVHYFLMGGGDGSRNETGRIQHDGEWRRSANWPPANSDTIRFYLQTGGGLTNDAPTERDSFTSYRYDPRRTVNVMGRGYMPLVEFKEGEYQPGPRLPIEVETLAGHAIPGRRIAERNDVIVFQTAPLLADTVVVGNLSATLLVSSDAPDTDFHIALFDVHPATEAHPAGVEFPISDGVLRARYRNGFADPELMKTGEKYPVRIELEPTANLFKAGHRIQLYVYSSNFPDYDVNRNNAELNDSTPRVATNIVYHELGAASFIELPVLSSE